MNRVNDRATTANREFPALGGPVLKASIHYRPTVPLLAFFLLFCFFVSTAHGQGPSGDKTFEELEKSATAAREAGRANDAIRDYMKALEIRREWSEGWWYLGTLQYDNDQYSEAIRSFQKLVQLAPGAGQAWSFLGLSEFETKDYANALEHLKKGQSHGNGDDPEITRVSQYHLALLLIRNGNFEDATSLLAAAFGQGTTSAQVQVALGLALLRVPLLPEEIDPSRDALIHAAGEVAAKLAQNDDATALEELPSLLKNYPNAPYIRCAYAKALASAGKLGEAAQQLAEEARLSPESAVVQIEISQLFLQMQKPQEAVRAAEEATMLSPDSPAAHVALGQALKASGKNERAAQELSAAQKLSPEKPPTEKRITQLYGRQNALHNPAGAPAAAIQANIAKGENFDEFSRQAAEAQQAGKAASAIENYQKALRLRPAWDDGRWNLAMLLFSIARYPEAITTLKNFVERDPANGTAWAVLGLSEFETGNYKNALIHLERGEELGFGGSAGSVRSARIHLAILLNRDGQFEKSMQTLAPESTSGNADKRVQFALGMALLRMRLLPDQIEPAKRSLVETAGEIAALLQNSKYDLAFPKFELLLKEYPATPFLHYAYATGLLALSRYDEAEKQLREELKISPRSELPYLRLASLSLKRHQPAEGLPLAERSAQIAPNSAEAHYLWGRASLELGRDDEAIRELETARQLSPDSPEVHFNLAKAYARAKLTQKADQERAIFTRLNALAEQQRSRAGNQAYGAHNAADVAPARGENDKPAPPRP
jgi:tetratricopeptide (TPR) repeat protein